MSPAPPALVLPPRPPELASAAVAAWREPVEIGTYQPDAPLQLPMFLRDRVYQGSSGEVYPLAFHERVGRERRPRLWDAVHLENPWIRLMILPELGGRIQVGLDRTRGYDFFYRNTVVKPALVGLTGPWISGGVEFNWPQHHRPSTYLPVEVRLDPQDDGSVTVWCSGHDPLTRMKGMHGVTLDPHRAVVELKVRLHNRTDDVQTFLWWANAAARAGEDYQSFFPPDVRVVADHARRALTSYPRAGGRYYGVDYPARVSAQRPDADRLDWYRNLPVPTSFMCLDSQGDFFGGYDHGAGAGFVHWADHRIAPGKKQWTWGNEAFGRAWDRHLSDGSGPYVELMAGVYTDNQPDFSFLAPGETKSFSQFWYPIQDVGPVQAATLDAAASLTVAPGPDPLTATVRVGVAVTAVRPQVQVRLTGPDGVQVWTATRALQPGQPLVETVVLPGPWPAEQLELVVSVPATGPVPAAELLRHRPPGGGGPVELPPTAVEPLPPDRIASTDELYLTGVHLAQYRHATRRPEPYWSEALRRDPADSRCAVALARVQLAAGDYEAAVALARTAIGRLTRLNPNPVTGQAHYLLGLALRRLDRPGEAYDAFAKAAWTAQWVAPACYAMAQLDARQSRWGAALDALDRCLRHDGDQLAARDLRVLVLRRLGRAEQAERQLADTLRLDPLDCWARELAGQPLTCDPATHLDVAAEFAAAGFVDGALAALQRAAEAAATQQWSGIAPLAHYHRAYLLDRAGLAGEAGRARSAAVAADRRWCFPHTLDDADALRAAVEADPQDACAAALLAATAYHRRRDGEAERWWRAAVALDPADAGSWRNLGLLLADRRADDAAAVDCYRHALTAGSAHPDAGRLLYEADRLAQRTGVAAAARLEVLDTRPDLVAGRDDLSVVRAQLLVHGQRAAEAVRLLAGRDFQPWEGGEGEVLRVWERAHLALARDALARGEAGPAQGHVRIALTPPDSLGEAPHPLADRSPLWLALGDCLAAGDRAVEAAHAWRAASRPAGAAPAPGEGPTLASTVHAALAARRLGNEQGCERLLDTLEARAGAEARGPAAADYFATSLPSLLFTQDPRRQREVAATLLRARVAAARGQLDRAGDLVAAILAREPSHPGAADLAAWLQAERSGGPALPLP